MYLRLFGGLTLERDGVPARGRSAHRRRLALLALLVAGPESGASRERILAVLWPEASTERGRRLLSESLYQIRRELGEAIVLTAGEMIRVDRTLLACDVNEFQQAISEGRRDAAIASYAGPFLDGWYVDDAPDFERWADGIRTALRTAYRRTVASLAAEADDARRFDDAAALWGRALAADSSDSESALRQAKALDAAGRRPSAVHSLKAYAGRLLDDFELSPPSEISALIAQYTAQSRNETTRLIAVEGQVNAIRVHEPVSAVVVAASPAEHVQHKSQVSSGVDVQLAPTAPFSAMWWRLGAASAALAVAIYVLSARQGQRKQISELTGETAYSPASVAVLYFDDHSQGRRLQHIADGLTEELIHQLAEIPALRVVSRNGVKRFREKSVPIDSLARTFRVGTIIEGSVQESADSIRVTVQVIDTRTSMHTHSEVFSRKKTELFALEQQLATSAAVALRRRLGQAVQLRSLARGTLSQTALEYVLRARSLEHDIRRIAMRPDSSDNMSASRLTKRADSLFALANAADADWPSPVIERGMLKLLIGDLGLADSGDAARDAARLASEALNRWPANSDAIALRGTARWRKLRAELSNSATTSETQAARGDLQTAVESDSTNARAWAALAELSLASGDLAESEAASRHALDQDAWLDGADQTIFMGFASTLMLGRFADAAQWCARGRLTFPDSWRFYECQLTLWREDTRTSPNVAGAWALVAKLDSMDPPAAAPRTGHPYSPYYRRAVAAAISARGGDSSTAHSVLQRLVEGTKNDTILRTDLLYEAAEIQYYLGDIFGAQKSLRALIAARPALKRMLARDSLTFRLNAAQRAEDTLRK